MIDLIARLHRSSHAIALLIANQSDLGLSQAEAHILATLYPQGSSTISDLYATFGHRRSTLTSVLDRLESRRLVSRSVDKNDRRVVEVSLTSAGKRLALRSHKLLSTAERYIRKRFSAAEISAFCRISDAFVELSLDQR